MTSVPEALVGPFDGGKVRGINRGGSSSGPVTACDDTSIEVALADIKVTWSPREKLNLEHIALLVESVTQWPPVVIHRETGRIVDGRHRLEAARSLGRATIAAVLFDGSSDEATLEAIRLNTIHGLPLNLRERKESARLLLELFPSWSDRRLAEVCGLSARTIASFRTAGRTAATAVRPEYEAPRIGRNGRPWRAPDPQVSERVAAAYESDPGASLRAIAQRVGVSRETVRCARQRSLDASESGTSQHLTASAIPPTSHLAEEHVAPASGPKWATDNAYVSTEIGRRFVEWFNDRAMDERTCSYFSEIVPFGRIYEVADAARQRSAMWLDFADQLSKRARG